MTKYFEELEAFIQNEYMRYHISLKNNLENKKITFEEYILNELNNYITNYESSESSVSNTGDKIDDSLRNDLENIYKIQNKELDSIIKKFIAMNQYFSKEQDLQNKINLFIDKFKIIALESNIEADKVFKQKIQNYIKEIDDIIDHNEEDPKKKLEELENIFKDLESKKNMIIDYFGNFISVIEELNKTKGNISNYNLDNKENYEYFKKTIENDFRELLNNLITNLNNKIIELSNKSNGYYNNFFNLLCKIDDLDNDFLTFRQFIDNHKYSTYVNKKKANEITEISRDIDEETNKVSNINFFHEVNGLFSYLKEKFDNNQYSENIEKYLKKICCKKIDNAINSFNIDNDTYRQEVKNKIDELFGKAKSKIEGKKGDIKKEIEKDKAKKEKWEEIKNNLKSF